jgi:hypothetical protein
MIRNYLRPICRVVKDYMQNTSRRSGFAHLVQRQVNPTHSGQAHITYPPEACGFTRREVRALVAEMLG